MLLAPIGLAKQYRAWCNTNGSSHIVFGNIAEPIVLETFPKTYVQNPLFYTIPQHQVFQINGVSNIVFGNVVESTVWTTVTSTYFLNYLFYNMPPHHLLNQLVLQQFRKSCCWIYLCCNLSKHNVAKTICFIATVLPEKWLNQCTRQP